MPVKVAASESLPDFATVEGHLHGQAVTGRLWRDLVQTELRAEATDLDGYGMLYRKDNVRLFTTVPDHTFLTRVLQAACLEAGISTTMLPEGLRIRRDGDELFAVNYAPVPAAVPAALRRGEPTLGRWWLPPGGVTRWRAT